MCVRKDGSVHDDCDQLVFVSEDDCVQDDCAGCAVCCRCRGAVG